MKGRSLYRFSAFCALLLLACGTIACGTTEERGSGSEQATSETSAPTSNRERLRAALDDADPDGFGEVSVRRIEFGRALVIHLKTPEGGFEGASWDDLDDSAGAAFKAVYGEAEYPATDETVVVFHGGLVDTTTGRDLPNANTGIYTLKGAQAKRIDWADDDALAYNIDWSNFRDFAHPALQP